MKLAVKEKKEKLQYLLDEVSQKEKYRKENISKILSIVDALTRTENGLQFLYDHISEIIDAGLLNESVWEHPDKLVPTLVKGTLCSGFPMIVYETLSELRMLKIAQQELNHPDFSYDEALQFLQDAIIDSFSFVFATSTEELRIKLTKQEQKRIKLLFNFILAHIPLSKFTEKLAREIEINAEQRPILTDKLEDILLLVKDNLQFDTKNESESTLLFFVNALFQPTETTKKIDSTEAYQNFLRKSGKSEWLLEAKEIGDKMNKTGLVSKYQVILLKWLSQHYPEAIAEALALNTHGLAELERHQAFVGEIIDQFVMLENKQVAYGLSKMLNRNLLSRKAVWNALNKLFRIKLHPKIKRLLLKSRQNDTEDIAEKLLCGGVISLLGQPLGVGQGMNPTCQSARGISMWSRHSPEKLLNMVFNAATANELQFRYEGELIASKGLSNEQSFDLSLDPVSVVLVPHLDDIYQQMMKKAMAKHFTQDPHVSVNPAFYGHWIQTGFISCYKPLINAIKDYDHFVRLFYAAFHPEFNNGYHLIYPIPLGIFITSSHGDFLGYHAVSLLRVKKDPKGAWRAYFFNPNNEGRQNWGQGIIPSVAENGELHGESSLPFHEFVSRVYAFHYNSLEAEKYVDDISTEEVKKVRNLAENSWGKKYTWI